ncbi:MAG: general secretion pathway protein E/type IV pilus assembly protein PilB [Verrucomicrobia bacterium]|nr:MAG: general secretion pathway protein E/type IV pilus assembly protein PilB [Verrucomicrobiota bacterium]
MYSNEAFIVELLQENGILTGSTISAASQHRRNNESTLETLLRIGQVQEMDITHTLAVASNMDAVDLNQYPIDPAVVKSVSPSVCVRYTMLPISFDGHQLRVAVADPMNMETLDSLQHVLPYPADFVCAPPAQIRKCIADLFAGQLSPEDAARIGGTAVTTKGSEDGKGASTEESAMVNLVNQILSDAFQARASDIHIEPLEKEVRLRYRIDGALHHIASHPRKLLPSIVSRIKIMTGSMSIAEKRIPQDGRIQAKIGKKELDLRVSTVPTSHGESIVMRILDKSSLVLGLPQLGFMADDNETFGRHLRLPDGIVLVTGPTGSGKTTTLYACLNEINKPDKKIITVEDPVEYQLSGINQVGVKADIGMTFHSALRAILRQAPNIIMIGEIRDLETATIAINASLTGHLVFSTLHTNDAPSAVARLEDMGVKRFLISSAVRAIMAQRLVRGLCKECKRPGDLTDLEIRRLGLDAGQLQAANVMVPHGCRECRNTGFRGRIGLFEIFNIDDEVARLINADLTTPQLRKRARELGMRTLREDGIRKVLAGITSGSEVIRVTMQDNN